MINNRSISIVVITYNSEKWILETLESIKEQTYKELELVIADDSSSDRTINICKNWIKINESRFKNIQVIEADKNEGITKNINKGIKAAKSEWIKPIAGDDILLKDCIQKNIEYCIGNKVENVFSKVIDFQNELKEENILDKKRDYNSFEGDAKFQFEELLKSNFVFAPTGFFKKSLIEDMGYFDEKYPMVEDYPMWLKITEKGIKLNFLNESTVYYRIHSQSVSNNSSKIINERMHEFKKNFYINYKKDKIKNPYLKYTQTLSFIRSDNIIKNGNKNKYTLVSLLTHLIDPNSYLKGLKKFIKVQ